MYLYFQSIQSKKLHAVYSFSLYFCSLLYLNINLINIANKSFLSNIT